MTRARVDIVLAWRVAGVGGRAYTHRFGAYYQVAKKLVIDKYPAELTRSVEPPRDIERQELLKRGWTDAEIDARYQRARALFCKLHYPEYGDESGASFDTGMWKRFVSRVAKFLMFVDDRTYRSHLHEQYERAIDSACSGAEAYRYREDDPR